jgi:hypothetical protein
LHLLEIQRADRRQNVYRFIEHPDFCELQYKTWQTFKPDRKQTAPPTGADVAKEGKLLHPLERSSAAPIYRYLSPPTGAVSQAEQQVLRLARRGWLVFSCKPRSKEPAMSDWQKLATADSAKISAWFKKFPDCNWGLRTGPASGVWVLDVDSEAGLESFFRLITEHGEQIDTFGVRTPRGSHLYFSYPAGKRIANGVNKLGAGLDIRGAGGYVLVPPSVNECGVAYEWLGESGENKRIAPAPDWLLELVTEPSKTPSLASQSSNDEWNEMMQGGG